MISPKAAELLIFWEAVLTSLFICAAVMTAPSTINPKSIAPKLIRLAEIPNIFIMETAKSIDSGMTEATIKPALQFPSINTKMKMTINPPSNKLVLTVPIAVDTSLSLTK